MELNRTTTSPSILIVKSKDGRLLFSSVILFLLLVATYAEPVGYNRDVRPILSDNCFYCHGPDQNKRKGKLRLDIREEAIKKAIVPGKPEESELIKRIHAKDPDDLMPPAEAHKTLTEAQKETLRQWIAEGAKYEKHWAYIAPVKPSTPANQNGIDFLVRERLKKVGLSPTPEADRRTLVRRLYFDLIGLPPKPEEVAAFEKDSSPGAYDALVDKLLASPQFGERMAIPWLDVVRFADTIGYHSDNPRNVWPFRDYVIKAFNENKPFDQFTREQLAGDLLPDSTLEQKVASGFNRLLLSTEEGGAQPKDYEARMLTDRVRAVAAVWLGQTIGCAQCHDHKFDPIKSRDFYSLGAFFADIKEPIIGRREDGMLVPNKKQEHELEQLDSEITRLQKQFDGPHPELKERFEEWRQEQLFAIARESLWTQLLPSKHHSSEGAKLELQADNSILVKGKKPEKDIYSLEFSKPMKGILALRIEALPDASLPSSGPGRAANGNFVISEIKAELKQKDGKADPIGFSAARADAEQTFAAEEHTDGKWSAASTIDEKDDENNGWAILPESGKAHILVLSLTKPFDLADGQSLALEIKQNHGHGNHTLGHFRVSATSSSVAAGAEKITPAHSQELTELLVETEKQHEGDKLEKLFALYKDVAPELASLRKEMAETRKAKGDLEVAIPRCLVSIADKPRTVRILPRGNFLNETGEIVQPALPGYLVNEQEQKAPLNRLDLANFLVSRDNPLTARVTMNRFWKQFFGMGLSKVLDDLGSQGEPPPNQPLLDWLACEFMDSGWDVKHMIRLIVTSDTYRQTSVQSKELRARDPYNRELACQSRWRLDAELVRDNALSVAGLLVSRIGGPSVKPYQPDGYWENLNFPVRTYDASKGADQYRRGLYTWWQRSYLHPSLLAFDAPTREECAAERNRSNIPQQALALLNDPTYVEASRVFAGRILDECSGGERARINWAWHQILQRAPRADELETAQALLSKNETEYKNHPEAAKALLAVGQSPATEKIDDAELAAWTNVARMLLNLHETITRS
jgi:hypothetical protein